MNVQTITAAAAPSAPAKAKPPAMDSKAAAKFAAATILENQREADVAAQMTMQAMLETATASACTRSPAQAERAIKATETAAAELLAAAAQDMADAAAAAGRGEANLAVNTARAAAADAKMALTLMLAASIIRTAQG
jgi:hypothetical protein